MSISGECLVDARLGYEEYLVCGGCGYAITSRPQGCLVSGCVVEVHVQVSMSCLRGHWRSHPQGSVRNVGVEVVYPLPNQGHVNDNYQ